MVFVDVFPMKTKKRTFAQLCLVSYHKKGFWWYTKNPQGSLLRWIFFPPGVGLGGKAEGRNFVAPMIESSMNQ